MCPDQCICLPLNGLLLIGVRVRESFDRSRFATEETVEIRADLVAFGSDYSMTLGTSRLGTSDQQVW